MISKKKSDKSIEFQMYLVLLGGAGTGFPFVLVARLIWTGAGPDERLVTPVTLWRA